MILKRIVRSVLLKSGSIYVTSLYLTGLSFGGSIKTLFISAVTLSLVNMFVRPLVKIVMLPINFLTLGLFSWFINVLMLYLTTTLVPNFSISAFSTTKFTYQSFYIPSFEFGFLGSFIAISFFISLVYSFLAWLVD